MEEKAPHFILLYFLCDQKTVPSSFHFIKIFREKLAIVPIFSSVKKEEEEEEEEEKSYHLLIY